MQLRKVLRIGSQLGVSIPRSLARSLGWMHGDYVNVSTRDGDIVFRNDTRKAIKFTHEPRNRRAEHTGVDAR